MTSILVTNIEWEKPAAHEICSFIDSSGKASGPIKRCLFVGYIIKYLTKVYAGYYCLYYIHAHNINYPDAF